MMTIMKTNKRKERKWGEKKNSLWERERKLRKESKKSNGRKKVLWALPHMLVGLHVVSFYTVALVACERPQLKCNESQMLLANNNRYMTHPSVSPFHSPVHSLLNGCPAGCASTSQVLVSRQFVTELKLFKTHNKQTNKLRGLSPRANYTDRAAAACLRS
jgi:hypothetical protein